MLLRLVPKMCPILLLSSGWRRSLLILVVQHQKGSKTAPISKIKAIPKQMPEVLNYNGKELCFFPTHVCLVREIPPCKNYCKITPFLGGKSSRNIVEFVYQSHPLQKRNPPRASFKNLLERLSFPRNKFLISTNFEAPQWFRTALPSTFFSMMPQWNLKSITRLS